MVNIGNKEMPKNKNIRVALSDIYGPKSPSRKILEDLNINPFTKVRDLTSEQVNLIIRKMRMKEFLTGELKEKAKKVIDEEIDWFCDDCG